MRLQAQVTTTCSRKRTRGGDREREIEKERETEREQKPEAGWPGESRCSSPIPYPRLPATEGWCTSVQAHDQSLPPLETTAVHAQEISEQLVRDPSHFCFVLIS